MKSSKELEIRTDFAELEREPGLPIAWRLQTNRCYLLRPRKVRCVVDNGVECIEWCQGREMVSKEKENRCLWAFSKMAGATSEQIVEFVSQWGPIGFYPEIWEEIEVVNQTERELVMWFREEITFFRETAAKVRAIMSIAADVNNDLPTQREDWVTLGACSYTLGENKLFLHHSHGDSALYHLFAVVSRWLNEAGVSVGLHLQQAREVQLRVDIPDYYDRQYDIAKMRKLSPTVANGDYILRSLHWSPMQRTSRFRAILFLQLAGFLSSAKGLTHCCICEHPCERHRRDRDSFCSQECREEKQRRRSREGMRKRRAKEVQDS